MTEHRTVRHLVGRAGALSESWLDAQIIAAEEFHSQAWALGSHVAPYDWISQPIPLLSTSPFTGAVARARQSKRMGGALGVAVRPLVPLARWSLHHDIDVYHAHFGPVAWMWHTLLPPDGPPLVVSFYGYDASRERFNRDPWRRRYNALFRRTAAVLVEGPAMAARVAALGFPEDRISVVRLPFANRSLSMEPSRHSKEWDVIMAGRFVAKKGFDDGLRAIAMTHEMTRKALVVGAGELEGRLRDLAEELQLQDRVVFAPPVALEDLAGLMARSIVALFPSHTAPNGDGEGGAPLTLPLAQFAGAAPVITTHDDLSFASAPGTPRVAEGDPEGLAREVDTILAEAGKEPETYEQRLIKGRSFVEHAHDAAALLASRERVYSQVCRA